MCSAKRNVRFTPNSDRESEIPQKAMSALPLKADMCGATGDVRFGPIADIKVGEYSLCGALDPCVDFAAQRPEIDRLSE